MTSLTFTHFAGPDFAQATMRRRGPRFGQIRAALPDMPSEDSTVALGAKILAGLAAATIPFGAIAAMFLYG